MIKNGDDVRQDQLVLQIIKVMDSCLKKVGLDLKLTVYGVLATGPKSGLLDFIMTKVPSITLITLMARVFSFPSLGFVLTVLFCRLRLPSLRQVSDS